jgi:hypothetical protein
MASIGYFLSCEQFGPAELVDQARREETGRLTWRDAVLHVSSVSRLELR